MHIMGVSSSSCSWGGKGGAGGANDMDCEAASDLTIVPPLLTHGWAAEPEAVRFNACICCAAGSCVKSPAHSLSMLRGGPVAADEYDTAVEVEEGGLPLDSWPRFSSSWAADSSDEEHEATAAAVAVQDAAGGGTGSKGGADHIIVRTPPISPIKTVGGGRGGAGAALCAGGFIPSPKIDRSRSDAYYNENNTFSKYSFVMND